jgi:endoglucanase
MKILTLFVFISCFVVQSITASPTTTSPLIKIDQFGYRPDDQKIAVISIPQVGYNAPSSFVPGAVYQVRDWITDNIVFTGAPVAWNAGNVHTQSGDKAFWFDFSTVTASGSYYIFDVSNNVGSYRFDINATVYNDALKQATRMLYYQRCGMPKATPYAQTGWTDVACHKTQDLDCRLYNNTTATTSKNLSGGWHDAGDYNKYVNFSYTAMVNLLLAYKENPSVWGDDFNIPESGNGIPDLLDEAKYELDWLLKMQNSNGSVLCIVGTPTGTGGGSPPSSDAVARVYGPATTSASFTSAAIFALAAIQFNNAGQTAYATTLKTAAINAYSWATANPNITFPNAGVIAAGEQEIGAYEISSRQFAAAVYLYGLTNTASYKTYVDANYGALHLILWAFAYPFETTQQDALLYYASLATATSTVSTAIKNAYTNSINGTPDNFPNFTNKTDAYQSYIADKDWTWNSNQTKSSQGSMFNTMNVYNLNSTSATNYKNAASGFIHYFHGVNPNGKTFLSNMSSWGAENSVSSFYHVWFANGSVLWDEVGVSTYGPPPGFIPGGPNPGYALDACCPGGCGGSSSLCSLNVSPPKGQPIQKSYKDFNDSWPLNSWTITEPGIYTNAAYIRLVSAFSSTATLGIDEYETSKNSNRIAIYPLPAKNEVNISFVGITERDLSLSVIDITGKKVMNKKINLLKDTQIETIAISSLSSGLYLFKIQGNNWVVTKKLIKQ